jgi:hypothetical protein
MGSAIVWSPPRDTTLRPEPMRPVMPASICASAATMSNGLHAMSPASTTCAARNGDTSSAGLYGRSSRDA